MAVHGPLIVDDLELVTKAALDGIGLAFISEQEVMPHLDDGTLVRVLQDWCQLIPASSSTIRVAVSRRRPSRH